MSLLIPADLLARLLVEAEASPDREICGLLFGEGGSIIDARPAANVATDPATRFEIDPATLLAAHRAQRTGGPRLIGPYHSHPTGDAVPSACDAAAAEPGSLWLILAGGVARAWRAEDAGFVERAIVTGS
jgi:proteasome lid subunit RPN8/RPN11